MSIVAMGPKRPVFEGTPIETRTTAARTAASQEGRSFEVPAASHRPDPRGYVYLTLMVLLGSTTSPFASVAVRELPVSILPLLRFGFATLCLMPFLPDRRSLWNLVREDGARLALVAALCVPVNQSFFLNAARLGPNSHVGLFYAVCPLVVWILAWALGHESLDMGRLGSVVASIAGVAVIGLGNAWGGGGGSSAETRSVMMADLLLVGAVVSWGAYLTLSKPLITRHGALPVLAGTFLLGCLMELPIALAMLPGWLPMLARASIRAWVSLAILALFITPVNLALQNLSLKRLDASQVATFSNVAPVLTVIWGVWFFHEALSPALLVGGTLTLVGVFWASRPRPAHQCAASRPAA